MPHPKDQKLRSKNRILQSATELFCRYGFDRVSISEIMRVARMTHGAFYAHFESKEALYSASIREIFERCRPARLIKGPLSVEHLTRLVEEYLNLRDIETRASPSPEAILINEVGASSAEIQRAYEAAYMSLRQLVERRIRALARLRALPFPPEPDLVRDKARTILAVLVGGVTIARTLPAAAQAERASLLRAAQAQIFLTLGVEPAALAVRDASS
ncbi:MAG: TetR/AcrR family transcriptional regulator [Thioalkalivibrionaceae bacterium]